MFDDARWGDDPRNREDEERVRDRDDAAWREPGRGGSDGRDDQYSDDARTRDRDHMRDPFERDRDSRDREDRERDDPRDVFVRHVDLPRGIDRDIVRDRGREYTLRGSETRTLSTVGAFRVVPARDLRDHNGRAADPRSGDLRHLREQGLIEMARLPGQRDHAVVLTKHGRDLLDRHRGRDQERPQTFYSGLKRERELGHDSQVFRAYEREAKRLQERGARIERVVLDYELKRDYQKWLHEHDRDRQDYDGHPDRDEDEIREWAYEHDLPYFDGQVHFPDVRIEFKDEHGRDDHLDVEVVTVHYRGGHAAAASRSGFSCYRGSSARVGGAPFDPDVAAGMFR